MSRDFSLIIDTGQRHAVPSIRSRGQCFGPRTVRYLIGLKGVSERPSP